MDNISELGDQVVESKPTVAETIQHKKRLESSVIKINQDVSELISLFSEPPLSEETEEEKKLDFDLLVNRRLSERTLTAKSIEESKQQLVEETLLQHSSQNELAQITEQRQLVDQQEVDIRARIAHKNEEINIDLLRTSLWQKMKDKLSHYKIRRALHKELEDLEFRLQEVSNARYQLDRKFQEEQEAIDYSQKWKETAFLGSITQIASDIKTEYLWFALEASTNQQLRDELNEEVIEQKVVPALEQSFTEGKITREEVSIYLVQLRKYLKVGTIISGYRNDEERQTMQDEFQQWQNFRQKINSNKLASAESTLGFTGGYLNTAHDYSNFFELLAIFEAGEALEKISDIIRNSNLPDAVKKEALLNITRVINPQGLRTRQVAFEEKNAGLSNVEPETLVQFLLTNSVCGYWDVAKKSSLIGQMFEMENWAVMEQQIADRVLDGLMETAVDFRAASRLGYYLLWATEQNPALRTKLAPFIIINFWRDFSEFFGIGASWPNVACNFFKSLTESELAEINTQNLPGLMKMITLIREHTNTFNNKTIENPDWKMFVGQYARKFRLTREGAEAQIKNIYYNEMVPAQTIERNRERIRQISRQTGGKVTLENLNDIRRVPNPVYNEVQNDVSKLCLHFLKQGDEKKQLFVLDVFRYLGVKLGENYQVLGEILKNTNNKTLQERIVRMVLSRYEDTDAAMVVLASYPFLSEGLQKQITTEVAPKLINVLKNKETLSDQEVQLLAAALNKELEDVRVTVQFIKEIHGNNPPLHPYDYQPEKLDDYVQLAKNQKAVNLIRRLVPYGFDFSIDYNQVILDMVQQEEKIFQNLALCRKISPDYKYQLGYNFVYNPQTQKSEPVYFFDPLECFVETFPKDKLLDFLIEVQREQKSFDPIFSSALLKHLRSNDPVLQKLPPDQAVITPELQESFTYILQRVTTLLASDENTDLQESKDLYYSQYFLYYLARQPEKVEKLFSLPKTNPLFFSLIASGGPLNSNRELVIKDVLSNGDAIGRVKQIETIFGKKVPYWRQLFLFTDTRIGDKLAAAASAYPITNIAGVGLDTLVAQHQRVKQQDPRAFTRLEAIVDTAANPEVLAKLVSSEINSLPFNVIRGGCKRLIFRDLLRRTVEGSRDPQAKIQADLRNRDLASTTLNLDANYYIHGSPVDVVDSVLLNGNLPQEALGEGSDTDSYPFHVDFGVLGPIGSSTEYDLEKDINATKSNGYGHRGSLGLNGQIFYLYRRTEDSYESSKIYGPGEEHKLILGGMPASEISGIVLRNSEKTLDKTKRAVLENGFYIPIYDIQGNLLFTPTEYDRVYQDLNLSVPVEVWGYSLKTGEQKGSNPGAEFTTPTTKGPTKYYVKFADSENLDKLWNEQLADNIYRYLGYFVPDTKIVRTEGSYGHASEVLPIDATTNRVQLKDGFLIDALLANWDIVANQENVVSSGGRLVRLDNGGALLFHARGEKKIDFSIDVTELETMRKSYPGLTEEDIQRQKNLLREKFTNKAIDQLVDSVRLGEGDRNKLKELLKRRRDYILNS